MKKINTRKHGKGQNRKKKHQTIPGPITFTPFRPMMKKKRQRKSQEKTTAEIKHHAQDDNKSTLAYIIQRSWTNRQIEPRSNLPSPIVKQKGIYTCAKDSIGGMHPLENRSPSSDFFLFSGRWPRLSPNRHVGRGQKRQPHHSKENDTHSVDK